MPDAAFEQKADIFLGGLTKILADLNKGGKRDPEMLALIGSLADRLVKSTGRDDWPAVKANLSEQERTSLIGTFSREIEDSGNKGDIRTAYAMQAIATSLVGSGFDDSRIAGGVDLLDRFIAAARDFYTRNAPTLN